MRSEAVHASRPPPLSHVTYRSIAAIKQLRNAQHDFCDFCHTTSAQADTQGGGLSHSTSPKKSVGQGCFVYSAYSCLASRIVVFGPWPGITIVSSSRGCR